MKRLLAVISICALLAGLALCEVKTALALGYGDCPCVVYGADGELRTTASALLAEPPSDATVTFPKECYDELLALLAPTETHRYTVEGIAITDGYSPDLDCETFGNGFNFQLAVKSDRILLGLPVILGGY